MTVADYIAEFLVAKGVRHVFGYQGSAMLKMLDSIVATGSVSYVQGFHEQASAFAADAYARTSGMPGVVVATSGPGATNLVTGIANAYFDSVPVLFLTGQDRRAHIRPSRRSRQNGFQDMDIVSMTKKVTKRAVQVHDALSLARELDRCWKVAQSGRKGPVLIDIPIDLQFEKMPSGAHFGVAHSAVRKSRIDSSSLKSVVRILRAAKRPVVLVGGGVRLAGASAKLDEFLDKTRMPCVSTLMGLDATKKTIGFTGIYGNPHPNKILRESDCILALGTRFAFHQTGKDWGDYAPIAKVVHVEIDEAELGRVCRRSLCVKGDLAAFLDAMRDYAISAPAEWMSTVMRWCDEAGSLSGAFSSRFLRRLFSAMPLGSVVTADVGSNQMLVAQEFTSDGVGRLLNSGGLGAMGYSLPAAIGASYVSPSPVVAICGDGGFQMNLQELQTLALRRRNVKVFVLDNSVLGLMRRIQSVYYGSRFLGNSPGEFACPDICRLAEVFGLRSMRISSVGDLRRLPTVFGDAEPWLVDVVIDPDDIVRNRYEMRGELR